MNPMFPDRDARNQWITKNGDHRWRGTRCTRCFEDRYADTVSLRCTGTPTYSIDDRATVTMDQP
jgi:hypothetical protein